MENLIIFGDSVQIIFLEQCVDYIFGDSVYVDYIFGTVCRLYFGDSVQIIFLEQCVDYIFGDSVCVDYICGTVCRLYFGDSVQKEQCVAYIFGTVCSQPAARLIFNCHSHVMQHEESPRAARGVRI